MPIERYNPLKHPFSDTGVDHWHRYEYVLQYGPVGRLLDAGCGIGYGSALLAADAETTNVVATDNSFEALYYGMTEFRSPKIEYAYCDDLTTFSSLSSFDTIVAFEVLEHLKDPVSALFNFWTLCHDSTSVFVSLPLDEEPGQNPFHLHAFDLKSAVDLCGKFFRITDELYQDKNIVLRMEPRSRKEVMAALELSEGSLAVFLQCGNHHNGAYQSSIELLSEMEADGIPAIVFTDDPAIVRAETGYPALYFPVQQSFGERDLLPRYLVETLARFLATVRPAAVYATHEFLPTSRFASSLLGVPLATHLRGMLDSAWYKGDEEFSNRFRGTNSVFFANSTTSHTSYADDISGLGLALSIVPNQISRDRLLTRQSAELAEALAAFKGSRKLVSFVASTRSDAKGFREFLAVVQELWARHPGEYCFGVFGDERGENLDENILEWAAGVGLPAASLYLSRSVDAVASVYLASDWIIVTSRRTESYCRVAFEAACLGVKSCCFSAGHLANQDEPLIHVVPFGDTDAVCECIANPAMEEVTGFKEASVARTSLLRNFKNWSEAADLPRILVVIPTSESGLPRLRRCLSSLARFMNGLARLSIVCVSSGSDREVIDEALQRYAGAFESASSVAVGGGGRFSFGKLVNSGVATRPPGEYSGYVILNDDTQISASAACRIALWGRGEHEIVGPVSNSGGGFHQDRAANLGEIIDRAKDPVRATPFRLAGFCLWVRPSVFESLGGFDEEFDGYGCDDTDFCLRACQAGYQLYVDEECYVFHEGGATYSIIHSNDELRMMQDASVARFLAKHQGVTDYRIPLNVGAVGAQR